MSKRSRERLREDREDTGAKSVAVDMVLLYFMIMMWHSRSDTQAFDIIIFGGEPVEI